MSVGDFEMRAYRLFEEHIRKTCRYRWRFLEQEDRISEASFVFIAALRIYPTNSGRFWDDYLSTLTEHMKSLSAVHRNQRCWISLNAPMYTRRYDGSSCTRLDFLRARDEDTGGERVDRFLKELSGPEREVLQRLMNGRTRRSVCMRTGLPMAGLKKMLKEIGERYEQFCRREEEETT